MTGYEDLDEYGDWSYVAGYGPCWRPRAVVAGWAPYRFGHWVYVGPWGWTWVEDEPWGFAPFHYGRWAFVNNGWFWVPGPVVVRPVWAPALVAFVGGGPSFHFSAGVGVGWFPLAPGEVYLPGYHVSRTYVNNVNITNTTVNVTKVTNVYNTVIVNKSTTINNITYVNQHVNNGVTVVSHDTFVNARPVAQNVMRVDAKEIASAPVSHIAHAEPIRTSVIGAGRPVSVRPPAAVISRPVVAVRTPPPPPRPIEQRQAQAGGHLNEQALVRPVGPSQPAQMNQRLAAGAGRLQTFHPAEQRQQPGEANAADAAAGLRAAGNAAAGEAGRCKRRRIAMCRSRRIATRSLANRDFRQPEQERGRFRRRRIPWCGQRRRCRSAVRNRSSSRSRSSTSGTSSGPLRRPRSGEPSRLLRRRSRRSRTSRRAVDADGRLAV